MLNVREIKRWKLENFTTEELIERMDPDDLPLSVAEDMRGLFLLLRESLRRQAALEKKFAELCKLQKTHSWRHSGRV